MTSIFDFLSHEKNRGYTEWRPMAQTERIIQFCFSVTAQTKSVIGAYLSQESLEGSKTGMKECAPWKNLYWHVSMLLYF